MNSFRLTSLSLEEVILPNITQCYSQIFSLVPILNFRRYIRYICPINGPLSPENSKQRSQVVDKRLQNENEQSSYDGILPFGDPTSNKVVALLTSEKKESCKQALPHQNNTWLCGSCSGTTHKNNAEWFRQCLHFQWKTTSTSCKCWYFFPRTTAIRCRKWEWHWFLSIQLLKHRAKIRQANIGPTPCKGAFCSGKWPKNSIANAWRKTPTELGVSGPMSKAKHSSLISQTIRNLLSSPSRLQTHSITSLSGSFWPNWWRKIIGRHWNQKKLETSPSKASRLPGGSSHRKQETPFKKYTSFKKCLWNPTVT